MALTLIKASNIEDGTVVAAEIADDAIITAKINADAVDGTKIADNSLDSEHYADGSIDLAHLAADSVDGTKIADNSLNSEHYTGGSIDNAHLATGIMSGKLTGALPAIDGSNLLGISSDISQLNANVALNFFLDAVDHARNIQNIQDGWTDQFEDQNGVNDPNSVNKLYDASGDFYTPSLGTPASPSDHYTKTLTSNAAVNDARTERQIIPAGSTDGDQIRITIESQASAPSNFDNISIGVRSGTTADCTAIPVEIKFSGGSGVDIQNGATAVSDWLPFTFDASLQHLIIFDMSSGTSGIRYTASSAGNYYKANANSYNVQSLSGLALQAVNTSWVTKIEVRSFARENMTLMAEPVVALAAPAKAHVTLFKQDVDAVTLNTDLLAWVSRSKQTVTSDFATDEKLDATAHGLVNTDRVMLTTTDVSPVTPMVVFDGSNDFLGITEGTLGAADSKSVLISFWIKFIAGNGSQVRIMDGNGGKTAIVRYSDNKMEFRFRSVAGGDVWATYTDATFLSGTLYHFLVAMDSVNQKTDIYVNGSVAPFTDVTAVVSDTNVDWTNGAVNLMAKSDGNFAVNAEIGQFYLSTEYLDITVEANRRKFISAAGRATDLGSDGSTPTGTAPLIFLNNTTSTWQNNLGSGGNFTETGALTDGTDLITTGLPAGLNSETVYYVVNKTTNDFEVSLTSGGSAVNITDNGTETHSVHAVTAVTLVDEGTYSSYDIIAASADISAQPSDTDMVLFLQTKNNKDMKIHGQSLQWED